MTTSYITFSPHWISVMDRSYYKHAIVIDSDIEVEVLY